jgi:hypothetical protein
MLLYRPVGMAELQLIATTDYRGFPPRLVHQPIFYPVLNEEYAVQIAQEWNTQDAVSGYAGFVTRFEVDDAYLKAFPIQTVGGRVHQELWIPAEELATFNTHIVGRIEVIRAFYGDRFTGERDPETGLPVL